MNDVRKSIGWADYTVNPIKGLCKHACPYCYARPLYKRFHWDPEIIFKRAEMWNVPHPKTPSRIFVCSTHDMMGLWIPDRWVQTIVDETYPFHTYFFLSKNPSRYRNFDWPSNCWLGTSITCPAELDRLNDLYNARINNPDIKLFVSFEPVLEEIGLLPAHTNNLDWAIIGGLTPEPVHKTEWIERLLKPLDAVHVPVYIKKNARYPLKREDRPS